MEQKNEQLTIQEAIEQGYKYAGVQDGYWSSVKKLEKLTKDDFESYPVFLAEKEGYAFTIDAKKIEELVTDYLADQDEVHDEDCILCELASQADYETLAADINTRLSTKRWYDLTNIQLLP